MDYRTALQKFPPKKISLTGPLENGWVITPSTNNVVIYVNSSVVFSGTLEGQPPTDIHDIIDISSVVDTIRQQYPELTNYSIDVLDGRLVTSDKAIVVCKSIKNPSYFDTVAVDVVSHRDINYSNRYTFHSGDLGLNYNYNGLKQTIKPSDEMLFGVSGYSSNPLKMWMQNRPVMMIFDDPNSKAYMVPLPLNYPTNDSVTAYFFQSRRIRDTIEWEMLPAPIVGMKSAPNSADQAILNMNLEWSDSTPVPIVVDPVEIVPDENTISKRYQVVFGGCEPINDWDLPVVYQSTGLTSSPIDRPMNLPIGCSVGNVAMLYRTQDEIHPDSISENSVFVTGPLSDLARKCSSPKYKGLWICVCESYETANLSSFWCGAAPGSVLVFYNPVSKQYYKGFPGVIGEKCPAPIEMSYDYDAVESAAIFGTREEYNKAISDKRASLEAPKKELADMVNHYGKMIRENPDSPEKKAMAEKIRQLRRDLKISFPDYIHNRDTIKSARKMGERLLVKKQNIEARIEWMKKATPNELLDYLEETAQSYLMYYPNDTKRLDMDELTSRCVMENVLNTNHNTPDLDNTSNTHLVTLNTGEYVLIPLINYDEIAPNLRCSWQDVSATDAGWVLFRGLLSKSIDVVEVLISEIERLSLLKPSDASDTSSVTMRSLLGALMSWCAAGTGKPNSVVYRMFGNDPVAPENELDWRILRVVWNALPVAMIELPMKNMGVVMTKSVEKLLNEPVQAILVGRSNTKKAEAQQQSAFYKSGTLIQGAQSLSQLANTCRDPDCTTPIENRRFTRRQRRVHTVENRTCYDCCMRKKCSNYLPGQRTLAGYHYTWATPKKTNAIVDINLPTISNEFAKVPHTETHLQALQGHVDFGPDWKIIADQFEFDYQKAAQSFVKTLLKIR